MAKCTSGGAAFWQRLVPALCLLGLFGAVSASGQQRGNDWPQFGWDPASSSSPSGPTGITAKNLPSMVRRQVTLDGTVDASAIYLHGVTVKGSQHDVFFVTTSYGKTIAIDASQGTILWEYAPPQCAPLEGTRQITNTTPAADPDRRYIYAASPDGMVQKLAVSDGHLIWKTRVTLLPQREKVSSPLKYFRGHIIAVTGGYFDQPPYQGHVAILDAQSGKLLHAWNSLCSDRTGLLQPSSCKAVRSPIWGRAGAVIDAAGDIFVATGNGPHDGKTSWGSSTIELSPDATKILANYTPKEHVQMSAHDLDLGAISPTLLGNGLIAQGGKYGLIRLLSLKEIAGDAPHIDHELQTVATPAQADMYSDLAVWRNKGQTWIFAANTAATAAWRLDNGRLVAMWKNGHAGTSPVVAGGLLYVYDPQQGGLHVYDPAKGTQIADMASGRGHWNSPIVVDGRIALPEGDANSHASKGVLDIWSLPPKR